MEATTTKPNLQPKTQRGQKKRQMILSAGRKVFAQKGFLNSRVVDIVAEAGTSVGNFYQYFADKDVLLVALLEEFVAELFESSKAGWARSNPYKMLERATIGLFEVYARNADLFKVMMEVANIDPKYAKMWVDSRRPFVQRLVRLLQRTPEFQRTGLDAAVAASALGSMTTNFAYIWIVMGGDFPNDVPVDVGVGGRTVAHLSYRAIYGSDPSEADMAD